jgi:hypothetical protein
VNKKPRKQPSKKLQNPNLGLSKIEPQNPFWPEICPRMRLLKTLVIGFGGEDQLDNAGFLMYKSFWG